MNNLHKIQQILKVSLLLNSLRWDIYNLQLRWKSKWERQREKNWVWMYISILADWKVENKTSSKRRREFCDGVVLSVWFCIPNDFR